MSKLELNSQGAIIVRIEQVNLTGGETPYQILYISDLHLGWRRSSRIVANLITIAQTEQPDLILLGGDLVDRRAGLSNLTQAVRELADLAPVWAIPGNHDCWVGVELVDRAILVGGGRWLEGKSVTFPLKSVSVRVDGCLAPIQAVDVELKILCAHNPIAFEQAQSYQLVLAGHLHGCQWVFWQQDNRLYPGAWFYRWNGLRFQRENTTLIVSRGVGDTLPIRWNCPREVILCQVF